MHCNVFDASLSLHNTVGVWGWGRGPDVATQVTYTMVLSNPTFDESPFRVTSSVGEIVSITESALDQSVRALYLYTPFLDVLPQLSPSMKLIHHSEAEC
eukprot:m.1072406 g.1072406  ORF g.1072406 m.1072406 type:complete len:99 (+) comp24231_c0_seq113:2635-2931(+)